jgi:hypothetical protein
MGETGILFSCYVTGPVFWRPIDSRHLFRSAAEPGSSGAARTEANVDRPSATGIKGF